MFGDSSQDIFSAVAFLRAQVTTPTGEDKNRACVCFGESARGANESNDCPKTVVASNSTCRSAEERNYSGTYCNC